MIAYNNRGEGSLTNLSFFHGKAMINAGSLITINCIIVASLFR